MKCIKLLYIAFLGLALGSCNLKPGATRLPTLPVEHITPTKDQAERRTTSEAYCKSHNIPIYTNPNALFTDPEAKVSIRTKDEVVDRAIALVYIGLKSEKFEADKLDKLDKKYGILSKLTPAETAYANAKQLTQQQVIDGGWKYEDLHVMLWALGFVDTLSYPDKFCNPGTDLNIVNNLTEAQFRQKAVIRSKKEILDQADLILRLDWACVDARTKNLSAPGNMDKGIVFERHYALNWLINFLQESWDNVTTDT
jgi:hypothetical protein